MRAKPSQRQVAAFFDLDLTLSERDTFRYFLREEYICDWRNWRYAPYVFIFGLLRKLRLISLQNFKEKALVSLIGKSKPFIQKKGRTFSKIHLLKTIRRGGMEKIIWHKENGHLVFIASSSPDIYVRPIVEYLMCDGYVCSRLTYRNNVFNGRFEEKDCLGVEKVTRLREVAAELAIDLTRSYAYSDHESDLPLLEYVGNPIVVSPTKVLRRIASQRRWKIEEW